MGNKTGQLGSFPSLEVHYVMNGERSDMEGLGQGNLLRSRAVQFSNELHLIGGKFADNVRLDSALSGAVSHVVALRSSEQMRWSKARRIVAMVKNLNPLWDWAFRDRIGYPMGQAFFAMASDLAVSLSVAFARPFNARIILRDVRKKLLQQFEVAKIVLHVRALQRLTCAACVALKRYQAFSIVPQEG